MTTKLREAERAANDLAAVHKKRADLAKSLASKQSDLNRFHAALESEETRDRKRLDAAAKKQDEARAKQLKELDRRLRERNEEIAAMPLPAMGQLDRPAIDYDVFISHASEDKDGFVRPLAERLIEAGLAVWYDDRTLKWGDSLRREIDKGLARSRFGVVVLSEHFFRKEWPQKELDGLVQLESMGRSRILPIWHKVSKDEVATFSPTLADKLALNTAVMTVEEIVSELLALSGKAAPEERFEESPVS